MQKKILAESLMAPDSAIREVIKVIDSSLAKIALVVDDQRRLLGTVTDGDVRRGLLRGIGLEATVSQIMNKKPVALTPLDLRPSILAKMRQKQIKQLPVLDSERRVLALELISEFAEVTERDTWVVIMAGGFGSRLGGLTTDCPKPLLTVGDKPLLETIVLNLKSFGFRNFYFAVNYRASMIHEYFGDGSKWGINIQYLEEREKMGTAGALRLMPERPRGSLVVMNGDLLTNVNFEQFLGFHSKCKAIATMAVREYDFQVPYGVVRIEKGYISSIDEKPLQRFLVNAGIYVIEPEALDLLDEGPMDMPVLFQKIIDTKHKASAFPIREYWLDIGQISDFKQANVDIESVMGKPGLK